MSEFYYSFEKRNDYQKLNDQTHQDFELNNRLVREIASYITKSGIKNIVEIGCGSGKIYDYLSQTGFNGSYTGIEMASYVINVNQQDYPNARWQVGSVYDLINQRAQYDGCLAFFVLEHLIYPERALESMLHSLKPGGSSYWYFRISHALAYFPHKKLVSGRVQVQKINFRRAGSLMPLSVI